MRIFIVDDHALIASALKEMIEQNENFKVINLFSNGLELKHHFENNGILPDTIILDINMPLMNGFETIHYIKTHYPLIKIVVLTMNDDENQIIKIIKEGVNGFVLKSSGFDELNNTLEHIQLNEFYFSNHISSLLLKALKSPIDQNNKTTLSENEIKFLNLICSELTYKQIADILSVSPKTIDGYRDNLFLKLNVKSRTGLVLYAIENNFYKTKT